MHPLLSPPHPSTPTPPHPSTPTPPTHSPLYVHSSHSLACAVCAAQALSPENVPAEMQTIMVQVQHHIPTYIQTDRQREREVHSVSMSALTVSSCLAFCVSCTHTHNEDHDTHQVGSMSSQHKATPLSHSHTKQHTEGGRVQLPQHHVQFLLPPLFPPSSLLPRIHPLPSLHSVHIPSHCHCWLVSWGTSVAQTCSVSPQPRPVEHWSKWQPPG